MTIRTFKIDNGIFGIENVYICLPIYGRFVS